MKKMLCSISFEFDFVVDSDYSTKDVGKLIQKEVDKYVDVALWNIGITEYSGKININQFKECTNASLQHILMEEKKRS